MNNGRNACSSKRYDVKNGNAATCVQGLWSIVWPKESTPTISADAFHFPRFNNKLHNIPPHKHWQLAYSGSHTYLFVEPASAMPSKSRGSGLGGGPTGFIQHVFSYSCHFSSSIAAVPISDIRWYSLLCMRDIRFRTDSNPRASHLSCSSTRIDITFSSSHDPKDQTPAVMRSIEVMLFSLPGEKDNLHGKASQISIVDLDREASYSAILGWTKKVSVQRSQQVNRAIFLLTLS